MGLRPYIPRTRKAMFSELDQHIWALLATTAGKAEDYPGELEREVTLDDGTQVRLRPIRPDDERRLIDLYGRLSRQTVYQRFFTIMKRLPSQWAHLFANVDYRRRLALVAEHPRDGAAPELIGVGRYEPTEQPDTAEIAFVVQDGWQGRGLGRILLREVLGAGEARGIRRFRALVLAENRRMLRLLARHTKVIERSVEDGVASLLLRPNLN
jgi:RimJ/RimL family protein N-acetyltransferase